jgi:hypothetical protein
VGERAVNTVYRKLYKFWDVNYALHRQATNVIRYRSVLNPRELEEVEHALESSVWRKYL